MKPVSFYNYRCLLLFYCLHWKLCCYSNLLLPTTTIYCWWIGTEVYPRTSLLFPQKLPLLLYGTGFSFKNYLIDGGAVLPPWTDCSICIQATFLRTWLNILYDYTNILMHWLARHYFLSSVWLYLGSQILNTIGRWKPFLKKRTCRRKQVFIKQSEVQMDCHLWGEAYIGLRVV